jgi:hypothetical protein
MKRLWMIVAVAALFAVLAGAAYVGGQLLSGGGAARGAQAQAGPPRKIVTPAAGMPSTPPDGRGDVTRMGDKNSIFICDDTSGLKVNTDGSVTQSTDACSPEIEVVIGHDTPMYRDISAKVNVVKPEPGGDVVISQVIELANGDDITTGTAIRVWGDRRGDRITARLVVYWNRTPAPTGQSK